MTLPIDMMREFCARHNLSDETVDEIQKIVDSTLIHIGRHLSKTETDSNIKDKVKKSATEANPDRPKCEGTTKKGEPCRMYALQGKKMCKAHCTETKGTENNDSDSSKKSESSKKSADLERPKCEGTNKKGDPCRFYALEGKNTCKAHLTPSEAGAEGASEEKKPKKAVRNADTANKAATAKGLAKIKELARGNRLVKENAGSHSESDA